MARTFTDLGFDVLSMDYRGYGKSKGERSEAAMLDDALRWHDWGTEQAYSEIRVWLVHGIGIFEPSGCKQAGGSPDTVRALQVCYRHGGKNLSCHSSSFCHLERVSIPKRFKAGQRQFTVVHDLSRHGRPYCGFASGKALADYLGDKVTLFPVEGATHDSIPWELKFCAISGQTGQTSKFFMIFSLRQ